MRNHIINIKSKLQGIEVMTTQLEKMCNEWEINERVAFSMNLALEEILSNIINYGLKGKEDRSIIIRFSLDNNNLRVQIKDDAPEFNPLDVAIPDDLDKSVEERSIGGLGIYLVKKFTDNFTYRRNNNKNIITLTKKLEDGD